MIEPTADILIVDDIPDNLRLLSGILGKQGYKCRPVPNGALALKAVESEAPDLILLDINMPGMNGYEVCAKLQADVRWREVPVIFLSAIGDQNDKVRAFEAGGVDYVTKPFQPGEILARIKTHLAITELRRSLRRMNADLEERVKHRTGELAASNVRLRVEVEERKAAEEQVQRLNADLERRVEERTEQLKASNRELEAFSYSVSHDLRAPLRAIEGFSAMAVRNHGAALGPDGQRLLETVRKNVTKMARLIEDLLTFSRTGRTELVSGRVEMQELARATFEELVPDPGLRAKIDFRLGDLPAVQGSEALLKQVWVNLLSNAVKFSSKAERPVVEVEGAVEGEKVVFRVRDNGAGFDMAYVGKLFGVFQRLHGETEFEGTGIGLALVQRVVERHGGRVWAEGAVGQGATFSFSIPAVPPAGGVPG